MFWLSAYGLVMGVVSQAIVSSTYSTMQIGNTPSMASATNHLQNAAYFPGSLFLETPHLPDTQDFMILRYRASGRQ